MCLQNDEIALFADKGDSGILAEESTAPTYNGKVICQRVAINMKCNGKMPFLLSIKTKELLTADNTMTMSTLCVGLSDSCELSLERSKEDKSEEI